MEERETNNDSVNHPSHYTFSEYEPIDVIEWWRLPYHLGNVVKYIARHRHKGDPVENLRKAEWYLSRFCELSNKTVSAKLLHIDYETVNEIIKAWDLNPNLGRVITHIVSYIRIGFDDFLSYAISDLRLAIQQFPKLRRIYLAVPYRHNNQRVIDKRAEQVTEIAAKLMAEQNVCIFSPITHSHNICQYIPERQLDQDFWMAQNHEFILFCDELWILALSGWKKSAGVAQEIQWAAELNIPIKKIMHKTYTIKDFDADELKEQSALET